MNERIKNVRAEQKPTLERLSEKVGILFDEREIIMLHELLKTYINTIKHP